MSDSWKGGSHGATTSWFTSGNWSLNTVPTISATGDQSVVISGTAANQPVIPFNQTEITVAQTVYNNGTVDYTALTETQIGGEAITLTNGADLSIQGIAMGVFYGNADTITAKGGTMSGLHGALSATPSFDSHMSVVALGNDTLSVETVNENFGLITVGNGDTLTIYNTFGNGSNQQALHGLINYGLITVAAGGHLDITAAGASGSTVANFYNAGWIEVDGGTLSIASSLLDGANTIAPAGSVDGYIEIGGGGDAILASTVSSAEEVTFTDAKANTLQITAGTLFSGTVNDFGASDTIDVNGFTSTSNATITTMGGVTELITANGSVLTTITLTGSITSNITTGTNSSGQEYIVTGGNTLANNTTYAAGTNTLTGSSGTLSNNGTVAINGAGTDLVIDSSITGTGGFFIDNGATLALAGGTGNDAGQSVTFGTHGAVASPNTLLINDNAAGFGGKVIGFGANDDIVLGGSTLPALTGGEGIALGYAGGVLTVSETNASGSVVNSSAISIAGTAALSTASFVALESSLGLNIEIAPAASTTYDFSVSGTGSFENYADYTGGVAPGDVLSGNMTVAVVAGTASVSSGGVTDNGLITIASGAGFVDNGSLTGTGALAVGGSATLGGKTTIGSVTDNGTLTVNGAFTDNGALSGTGALVVGSGHYAQFSGAVSLGSILDSGAIGFLGSAATGTINLEGNAGSSVVFGGTGSGTRLVNFGTNDIIGLGTSVLALPVPGTSDVLLSYNTSTGVLTIEDTANSTGSIISAANVTVSGIAGNSLSTASFVAVETASGVEVELAGSTALSPFTFSVSGTGSFEAPSSYTGGTAPGDVISSGETVVIATGTASVSNAGVTDNGLITVASGAGFIDAGSLTGTGTLAVSAGGSATLAGATTLGSITDAGTLVLGGADAAAITLASGAQAMLASNFSDSAAIIGAGTLSVKAGVTASLASGSSVASVLDSGTLDLAGSMGGVVNMEGNGANSAADFSSANAAAQLVNFGTSDDIILAAGALAAPPAGDGLALSYGAGVLTVTETNSSGSSIGSDAVTVAGMSSLSSAAFVALENSKGINIELAPTTSTSYDFSTTGTGSFEAYANYTGGTAPGDTLTGNMTVAVEAGTASVSSSGVTDNGLITIASGAGFLDAGSLTGTGSLVVGGSATLTGATTLGSITDAGTLVLGGADATAITLASGAQVTVASSFSDSAAITGAGTLSVEFGVTGTLASGSSVASVLDGGTLDLAGSMGGAINMEGNGANSAADFLGADLTGHVLNTVLTNFGTGDKITLGAADFALNGSGDVLAQSYNAATGQLTVTDSSDGAAVTLSVGLSGGDSASFFKVSDATGQLVITLCFYAGTMLATPDGEMEVEKLAEGDMLLTANGAKPVRWIGQSHVHTRFADPLRALPIRIRAGALGDGLPGRDLLLSPDHAICLDGVLVQASALVNGATIIREYDVPEEFTYYHVELDTHELLLAEGVQAESFVDNVDRMHFHNWDDRTTPETPILEMDLPRAKSSRQVPLALRHRLGLDKAAVA